MKPPACGRCGAEVTGYALDIAFVFEAGQRHRAVEEVRLSCGCAVLGASFDAEETADGEVLVRVVDLDGAEVLAFADQFEERA